MASTIFTVPVTTITSTQVPKTIRQRCRILLAQQRGTCNRIVLIALLIAFAGLGTYGLHQTISRVTIQEFEINYCILYNLPLAINSLNQFGETVFLFTFIILLPRYGTRRHTKFKKICNGFLVLTVLTALALGCRIIPVFNHHNNGWDSIMFLAPLLHVIYHLKYFFKRGYTVNYHVNAVDRRLRNRSIDPQLYDNVYPGQRKAIEPREAVTQF